MRFDEQSWMGLSFSLSAMRARTILIQSSGSLPQDARQRRHIQGRTQAVGREITVLSREAALPRLDLPFQDHDR